MGHSNPKLPIPQSSDLISSLHLSQQAPLMLSQRFAPNINAKSATILSYETFEEFREIEQLLLSCLQTGDDKSALSCLGLLEQRFGASNERVIGLRGLYEEAIADGRPSLECCLRKYDALLLDNPVNVPVLKRRVALLRTLSRASEAIQGLVDLLKAFPTDAEAWCELSDLYQSQGMSFQAVFSLEEALLIAPNSWNIHARLGELQYLCACSSDSDHSYQFLRKSIRSFCRSIELCDDYLRGFYGLALASTLLLENGRYQPYLQNLPLPQVGDSFTVGLLENLNTFAKSRVEEIIEGRSKACIHSDHHRNELIAAKELLTRLERSH